MAVTVPIFNSAVPNQTVHITGSFPNWNPSATPMTRVDDTQIDSDDVVLNWRNTATCGSEKPIQ